MRTAPDKDRHPGVTDRDVDSSNATLNTLFRGARQKSWMMGSGAPVRPTPRPSTSRTAVPQVTSPQRTNTAQLATPQVQSSPRSSPNATINGSRTEPSRRAQIDENQYPTPNAYQFTSGSPGVAFRAVITPHTEAQTETTSSSTKALPNQGQGGDRVEIRDSASPFQILPTPIPTVADGQGSARTSQPLQSPTLSEPGVTLVDPLRQAAVSSVLSMPTPEQPAPPQDIPNQNPGTSRIHSSSPRIASGIAFTTQSQNQTPRPLSATPSNPNKRQRIAVPTMPSLKPRVALINAHIASAGGNHNLNNGLERPRFQLLTEACNTDDAFYVALHQLFCAWDSNRQDLANIVFLPPGGILLLAFRIVGQLIRDNEGLAPNHLKWFARFPSPLSDLLRTSEPYRSTISDVGIFLGRLTSEWAPLSKQCSARGYPPLVDELVNILGLLSPILQQVVFTATRRNLGIVDDRYGQEMESIFLQDRKGHQELAARFNTARPPTEKEVTDRNRGLAERYLSLHNQQQQQRRVSGVAVGSPLAQPPTLPGNVIGQGSISSAMVSSHRSSMDVNQAAWTQNGQSPDLSGNWQGVSQQMQTARAGPSGSPNQTPGASIARPLSVVGQRPYENTPSPTFMQNLSMQSPSVQSPVQQSFQRSSPVLRSNEVSMQPVQTPQAYSTANPSGIPPQNTAQNLQQGSHNPMQHQYSIQQHNQQQQLLTAQQARQTPEQQQWHQQSGQYQQHLGYQHQHQAIQHIQPHQLQQQAIQQPMTPQQQQHQMVLQQQVLGMNRTAQLRGNSNPVPQHRVQSRNNSVTRPSPNGSALSNQIQLNAYAQQVNTQTINRSLVPPLDFVYPAQPPAPDMTALHQAHVRSPHLVPADFEPSDGAETDPSRRFYQTVKDFAMEPVQLPLNGSLSRFEFTISEESFSMIAKDTHPTTDRLANRVYRHGTLQYRLRCIQMAKEVTKCLTPLLPDWVVSDTVWPESIFMEINDQHLEVRRKNHHGKDLAIDITRFIIKSSPHQRSSNRLKISVPRQRKDGFFIAVEVIEILQHQQILDEVTNHQRIPSSQTLAAIKKSLSVSDDDDDVAMVMSDLSVDLADPFTSRIFDIPVKGSSCLHRECFDLETFLQTRNSKAKRPSQPCMIDVWKCPLCSKDARPYSLQIVDYLADVRATLAAQDNLEVKAILISADGTWKPKPEALPLKRKATNGLDTDEDSSDDDTGKKPKKPQARQGSAQTNGHSRRQSMQAPIEIIDLDD